MQFFTAGVQQQQAKAAEETIQQAGESIGEGRSGYITSPQNFPGFAKEPRSFIREASFALT